MQLAVRFSPPDIIAGSQRTVAEHMVPSLFAAHADTLLFTSVPEAFPSIPRERIVATRPAVVGRSALASLMSQAVHELTFEQALLRHGRNVVFYPYTHESTFWMRQVRQVVTVHDVIPLVFPEQFPKTSLLWRWIIGPKLRRADAILADSESTAADLHRLVGVRRERVRVSHLGFRKPPTPAALPTEGRPFVLYVASTLYPYKNAEMLGHAFAQLTTEFPHDLVIVARRHARFGSEAARIQAAVGDAGRLRMVEDVSDAELGALYAAADVFVYPSSYEGFGIPPLEAMSAGVPVVASRSGSIPEICGNAAEYCDSRSAESIAGALRGVLRSRDRRAQLRALGLERVKEFTWQASAARIIAACRSVAPATALR